MRKLLLYSTFLLSLPTVAEAQSSISKDAPATMSDSVTHLKELVVKTNRPLFRRDGEKIVFMVNNVKNIEGMQAVDVLKYAPHLSVTDGKTVKLDGKVPAVYVDGRKLNASEAMNYIGGMQGDDIQKVEIQQQRTASQDADEKSGAIYIYTKRKKGINGSANLLAGVYDKSGTYVLFPGLNLNVGTDNWNIYASGRSMLSIYGVSLDNSDVLYDGEKPIISHQNNLETANFNRYYEYKVGMVWEPGHNGRHTLSMEYHGDRKPGSRGRSNGCAQKSDLLQAQSASGEGHNTIDLNGTSHNVAFAWKWLFDKSDSYLNVLVNYYKVLSYMESGLKTTYNDFPAWNAEELDVNDATANSYSAQADLEKHLSDNWKINAGAKYMTTSRKNELNARSDGNQQLSGTHYTEAITAGYASVNGSLGKVSLSAGVRVEATDAENKNRVTGEKNSRNFVDFLPDFSLNYQATEKLNYIFSYNQSITRPQFSDLNGDIYRLYDIYYHMGNPDLTSFTTHTGKFELDYGKHSLSLEYNSTTHMIGEHLWTENGTIYSQNANIGTMRVWNIGYNFTGNISPWWSLNLFVKAYHTDIPSNYDYKKSWTGYGSLSTTFNLSKWGQFILSFEGITDYNGVNVLTKGNFTVNASYARSFFNKSLNVRLGIYDIFNTSRIKTINHTPMLLSNGIEKATTRFASIRLTYTFKSRKTVQSRQIENDNDIQNRLK